MEYTNLNSIYSLLAQPAKKSFTAFIESKLTEMGITRNFLCTAIQIDNKSLTRILSGEAQKVDIITILKLGDFLGVDFHEIVQHYIAELETEEIKKIEAARKAGFILRNFDLESLKKIGFIKQKSDFYEIEQRILNFFGFESLLEYEQGTQRHKSLFSRTRNTPSDKILKFWCTTAIKEFKVIANPYPFDMNRVKIIITNLSISTSDEVNGLKSIVRQLYRAGVTVILNPYVGRTQVRGATFIINDKPCIIIQDFRKTYDTIWFALAHELCHIIKDLKSITINNPHLTVEKGEHDLFIDEMVERRADNFAAEILLPDNKLRYIAGYIDMPGMVKKYAKSWQVSESIIYGQYAYRYNEPLYYNKSLKADTAVRQLMIKDLFKEENVETALELVKNIYN